MAVRALSARESPRVAIVTTDQAAMPEVERALASTFDLTHFVSNQEALSAAAEGFAALILDLDTPGEGPREGLDLLPRLRGLNEDVVLVAISRTHSRTIKDKALTVGADEFFLAPVDFQALKVVLERALENRRSQIEARKLRQEALSKYSFCELIGGSEPMRRVYEAITRVADSNTTVVIRGESGTGKELVARAIVASGSRSKAAFVGVNCAALPESLIEAELFGHEKGSFTGAHESRAGHIEAAHGGTLFLDEISSLGLALQSKLLRVLEERTVQRIGAKTAKKIDFRLLTATNGRP